MSTFNVPVHWCQLASEHHVPESFPTFGYSEGRKDWAVLLLYESTSEGLEVLGKSPRDREQVDEVLMENQVVEIVLLEKKEMKMLWNVFYHLFAETENLRTY